MNCTGCNSKSCRHLAPCHVTGPGDEKLLQEYHTPENQEIVRSASKLVDGGRAGTLSRIEEIAEYARNCGHETIGLAYCYGMEKEAASAASYFRKNGIKVSSVSCTAGGFAQDQINEESSLPGVSCNPISQAEILNRDGIQLAVTFGLCMGHDILFNRYFNGDVTVLVVKDRTNNHNPLEAVKRLAMAETG